ncbi:MAG: helix-turn-helix transcriptional regulator [Candidatus Marinimicrobia bacterium]|jgi:DNA-binding XRE family transcriptional regulator|nr:helix-turn-helix transcriptional regulator [Candidatus Neomarinimicrobiota bacterium]MBT3497157.1 helix-turn-helix transcriptional regulator [Candidatus Neomarinimicrobiota bacterium]MBT3691893.1 helix-turn-helix transcriptional regulator [Candidatus Neomarinimicrobiota bacterium]MBT3732617.1 helix-turn-helix transcriptional regulator [Candidatus Neomarinimicrobiota bacterium]MBT4144135.1 helix-turn-helix transcriptional regulator [Candidatus Neomarinimicrobiota bacterium]
MHIIESPKSIEDKVLLSLKMSRRGQKMTQKDLAKSLDVSRDTIARLESGKSRVTLAQVIAIARILDLTIGKLLIEVETQSSLDSISGESQNKSSTAYPGDYTENPEIVYSIETRSRVFDDVAIARVPTGNKLNPFLSTGAITRYGDKMETFILNHKTLWWGVGEKDLHQISISSVVEAILNFGGDQDIAELFRIVSMETVSEIFKAGNQGSRTNYKSEIVNYYDQYFKKHVPGYTN